MNRFFNQNVPIADPADGLFRIHGRFFLFSLALRLLLLLPYLFCFHYHGYYPQPIIATFAKMDHPFPGFIIWH